jgi:oligopeptide/dipeptide ABC transporter ATP-binding protein
MVLDGDAPNLYNPPSGCIFCDRCHFVVDRCRKEAPEMRFFSEGHQVACHFAGELPLKANWKEMPC